MFEDAEPSLQSRLQQTSSVRQELDLLHHRPQRYVPHLGAVGGEVGHIGEAPRGRHDSLHHELVPRLEEMEREVASRKERIIVVEDGHDGVPVLLLLVVLEHAPRVRLRVQTHRHALYHRIYRRIFWLHVTHRSTGGTEKKKRVGENSADLRREIVSFTHHFFFCRRKHFTRHILQKEWPQHVLTGSTMRHIQMGHSRRDIT